jgi:hypothetical protein
MQDLLGGPRGRHLALGTFWPAGRGIPMDETNFSRTSESIQLSR